MTSTDNQKCLLSLCMIVRDNESIIRDCLESISPFVDEMIVVDTGSVDQTPNIAKELGAKVYDFPWCDDFSAARNESLKYATGEWVFWMDSDDTISEENGRGLRELVSQPHAPDTLAFVMQVHCPGGPEAPTDKTVVDHVKVFRNHPKIRFEGRIHEQVLQDIRALGGEVRFTDLFVTHSGSDHSKSGKKRKIERDLRCLQLDLAERPDHPFVLFNLGMTYSDIEEHEQAADWLFKCLNVSGLNESHVRKAYALLVHSLYQLEKLDQAHEFCQKAIDLFPEDPELRFRMGIIEHALGNHQASIDSYKKAIGPQEGDRYFSSLDPAISGYKARHNLALVYQDSGRNDLAELTWRLAIEEAPLFRQAWRKLGELLISAKRVHTADILISQMEQHESLEQDRLMLEGMRRILDGDFETAWQQLDAAADQHPDETEIRQSLSRFLFDHGRPSDAERGLLALCELLPEDGACRHNLGIVYRMMNKPEEALQCFEESLSLRPGAQQTIQSIAEVRAQIEHQTSLVPSGV